MPNWVMNKVRCNGIEGLTWIKALYCDGTFESEGPAEERFSFEKVIPLNGNEATERWGTKWDANMPEFMWGKDPRLEFRSAWSTPKPVFHKMARQLNRLVWVEYADEDEGFNCGACAYTPAGYIIESDKTGDPDFAARVWGYEDMEDRIRKSIPGLDPEVIEREILQTKEWWEEWHAKHDLPAGRR